MISGNMASCCLNVSPPHTTWTNFKSVCIIYSRMHTQSKKCVKQALNRVELSEVFEADRQWCLRTELHCNDQLAKCIPCLGLDDIVSLGIKSSAAETVGSWSLVLGQDDTNT